MGGCATFAARLEGRKWKPGRGKQGAERRESVLVLLFFCCGRHQAQTSLIGSSRAEWKLACPQGIPRRSRNRFGARKTHIGTRRTDVRPTASRKPMTEGPHMRKAMVGAPAPITAWCRTRARMRLCAAPSGISPRRLAFKTDDRKMKFAFPHGNDGGEDSDLRQRQVLRAGRASKFPGGGSRGWRGQSVSIFRPSSNGTAEKFVQDAAGLPGVTTQKFASFGERMGTAKRFPWRAAEG